MATAYGHTGPIAQYNSLQDRHLNHYFTNSRVRRHLCRAGLITKEGQIIDAETYRIDLARKEREKGSRDLLSKMIMDRTLEMERSRKHEIRQRLQEISKLEIVRRVKSGVWGSSGSQRPVLGPKPHRAHSARHARRFSRGQKQTSSSSSATSLGSQNQVDGGGSDDYTPTRLTHGTRLVKSQRINDDEIFPDVQSVDTNQLHQVVSDNRLTGFNDSRMTSIVQPTASPYQNAFPRQVFFDPPVSSVVSDWLAREETKPVPPSLPLGSRSNASIALAEARLRRQRARSSGDRLSKTPPPDPSRLSRQVRLRRTEIHSLVNVTFKYLGLSLKLEGPLRFQASDVEVVQQHCGGNTRCLFRGKVNKHDKFRVTSLRHLGMPFALTFYLNSVQVLRISTCCEYKHQQGRRINRHFSIVSITGGKPCDICTTKDVIQQLDDEDDQDQHEPAPGESSSAALLEPLPSMALADSDHGQEEVSGEHRARSDAEDDNDDVRLSSMGVRVDDCKPESDDEDTVGGAITSKSTQERQNSGSVEDNADPTVAGEAGGRIQKKQKRKKSSERPSRPVSRQTVPSSSESSSSADSTSSADSGSDEDFASDASNETERHASNNSHSEADDSKTETDGHETDRAEDGEGSARLSGDDDEDREADAGEGGSASEDESAKSGPDKHASGTEDNQHGGADSGENSSGSARLDGDTKRSADTGGNESTGEDNKEESVNEESDNQTPDAKQSAEKEKAEDGEVSECASDHAASDKDETAEPGRAGEDHEAENGEMRIPSPTAEVLRAEAGSPARVEEISEKDRNSDASTAEEKPNAAGNKPVVSQEFASLAAVQDTEHQTGEESVPATEEVTGEDREPTLSVPKIIEPNQEDASSHEVASTSNDKSDASSNDKDVTSNSRGGEVPEEGCHSAEAAAEPEDSKSCASTHNAKPPNESGDGQVSNEDASENSTASPDQEVPETNKQDVSAEHESDVGSMPNMASQEMSRDRHVSSSSLSAYGTLGDAGDDSSDAPETDADESRDALDVSGSSRKKLSSLGRSPSTHLDDHVVGARPTRLSVGSSILPMIRDENDVELTNIDLSDEQLQEVCEKLNESDRVSTFVLRNTSLTKAGLQQIQPALSSAAQNLKLLNLNLNKMDAEGAEVISEVLRSAPNLQMLLLHGNPIGDEGVVTIVDALLGMAGPAANQAKAEAANEPNKDSPTAPDAANTHVDRQSSEQAADDKHEPCGDVQAELTAEEAPAQPAAEKSSTGTATEELSPIAATENPLAEITTEEPSAEQATEEAQANTATDDALANTASEEAPAETAEEEAPAETATEEAQAEPATTEAPTESTAEEVPGETAKEEAQGETATEEAQAEAASGEAPEETATQEPIATEEAPAEEATRESQAETATENVASCAAAAAVPPIQILDLGDCNLTDKCATSLSQLLTQTKTLSELNLSGNCFSAPGLADIGDAIGKNTSLTSLSLDYCGLGDAGIKAMAVGLAMNSSLVSIDVESTGLSDQSVEYLLEVLLHNKSLESINLSRNSISQGCWQSVKRTLAMRTRRKSISM